MTRPAMIGAPRLGRTRVRLLRRWLTRRWGPLAPHGAVLVGLYALFVLLANLISFGRVERGGALLAAIVAISALFLAMIGLFVVALWRALRDTIGRDLPGARRQILLFTLGAGLCLLLLPRLFSKDVLSYLVYGRAFGAYGLNPYVTDPTNIQFDWNFRLIDWHSQTSVYGPVWTLLSTALYKLVALLGAVLSKLGAPLFPNQVWGYVTGFRVVGLAFHLGNAALVWTILGRLRPREQVAGTLFYAWNPLTLIEFPGNGHNDVALIFFLLAALAVHLVELPSRLAPWRPALVVLCLTLSVLTKFITLLVVPAYLLLLWRGAPDRRAGLVRWGQAGLAGLVSFVLLWAPFREALRDPLFLLSSPSVSKYDNSALEVVYFGLRHLLGTVLPSSRGDLIADQLVKMAGRLAFLALWVFLTWRVRDTEGWIRASFWMLFGYLVLGTPLFWPWYVTWLVALAPLVGERRATAATLTFSASVLVIYLLWGNQLPFDRGGLYPLHNIVAFGLPLLILWLQLRRGGAAAEPVYAPPGGDAVRNLTGRQRPAKA